MKNKKEIIEEYEKFIKVLERLGAKVSMQIISKDGSSMQLTNGNVMEVMGAIEMARTITRLGFEGVSRFDSHVQAMEKYPALTKRMMAQMKVAANELENGEAP
jgi:hypothetical protein